MQTTLELDLLKAGLAECDTDSAADAVTDAVAVGLKGKQEAGAEPEEGEGEEDVAIGQVAFFDIVLAFMELEMGALVA